MGQFVKYRVIWPLLPCVVYRYCQGVLLVGTVCKIQGKIAMFDKHRVRCSLLPVMVYRYCQGVLMVGTVCKIQGKIATLAMLGL